MDDVWQRNPELIKRFLEVRPGYELLCAEVDYILRKRITDSGIEKSSITSRAKSLNSFLNKLQRKHYDSPFEQVTDLAGVRVVCLLYRNDIARVADMIRAEFEIAEDVDKVDKLGIDRFGYVARHFIVKLGKISSGARYDDLKQLPCEMQVRTVGQDAWAIIQHHMIYKQESQVPTQFQRKLNSLAALFETIDDQFECIRNEIEAYLDEIHNSPDSEFLESELNLDSFKEYLRRNFPDRTVESWDGQARLVFDALVGSGYKTLNEVDAIVEKTAAARHAIGQELDQHRSIKAEDGTVPSNLEPALALALSVPNGEFLIPWGSGYEDAIRKHRTGLDPI